MPFCTTHFRTYPAEHSGCITCYQGQAKISTSNARKEQKQANVLAKSKTRLKQPVAIQKVSKKQGSINAELSRIKKELLAENPICFSSGERDSLTLSHILPRQYTKFIADRRNLVLEHIEAHTLYEHHKKEYALMFPVAWAKKLEIAKELDTSYYYKLLDKIK